MVAGGKYGVKGQLGSLDQYVHTAMFEIDKQQGHRELCTVLCGSLERRGV